MVAVAAALPAACILTALLASLAVAAALSGGS
jgi:hypothetical protein